MAVTITPTRERVPASAWRMLALGVSAQAAGSLFLSTPAYLIPLLHLDRGVPLAQAGLLAAAPSLGMVLALDRKSTRLNSSHIQKSRMPSSA